MQAQTRAANDAVYGCPFCSFELFERSDCALARHIIAHHANHSDKRKVCPICSLTKDPTLVSANVIAHLRKRHRYDRAIVRPEDMCAHDLWKSSAPQSGQVTFVGTGASTGTPIMYCLRDPATCCPTCADAMQNPFSKNRRRNPSLLIEGPVPAPGQPPLTILIDCGKTFKEAMVNVMRQRSVEHIDAVVITHGHADAYFGLDDLREWRMSSEAPLQVFVSKEDMPAIRSAFPYLVDRGKATGSGFVSSLQFIEFEPRKPFLVCGLEFTPLRVHHGNTHCYAFAFGNTVYMSDCSEVPRDVMQQLMSWNIDLMILDGLHLQSAHAVKSHMAIEDSVKVMQRVAPKRAYITGISHSVNHDAVENGYLARVREESGLRVHLPWDGLCVQGLSFHESMTSHVGRL